MKDLHWEGSVPLLPQMCAFKWKYKADSKDYIDGVLIVKCYRSQCMNKNGVAFIWQIWIVFGDWRVLETFSYLSDSLLYRPVYLKWILYRNRTAFTASKACVVFQLISGNLTMYGCAQHRSQICTHFVKVEVKAEVIVAAVIHTEEFCKTDS